LKRKEAKSRAKKQIVSGLYGGVRVIETLTGKRIYVIKATISTGRLSVPEFI
jgi:hypothetical protein